MHRKWWTLIVVSVATFMLLLDITVVNTALPSIRADLGGSFTDLQWVIDAYTLSLAALVLTAGVLADRLGRRRVFGAGLAIFTLASALAGLAPDPTFLNITPRCCRASAAPSCSPSLWRSSPRSSNRAVSAAWPWASMGPRSVSRWPSGRSWAERSPRGSAGSRSSS